MLDEAKAEIAADCANANVSAALEAIQADINKALSEAATAYTAVATEGTFKYDINYGDIENPINALVPEAKRLSENKAAYDETVATLQGMQEMLDEAKANVAKNYPAANVDAQIEAARKAINDGIAGANEAYEAVAAEGTFKFDINYGSIEALIAAVEAEAKRQADNNSAYNDIVKAIDTLQTKLDMAKMTATQIYPESDVTATVAAAQDAINQAKEDALKAKEDAGAEGEINYTVPAEEIEALIAKVLAEAKRQADNAAAYKAVETELAALQGKLDAAKATVEAEYEGTDVAALVAAAQLAIDNAETAAAEAKEAVVAEGAFAYEVPAADIEAAIAAIVTEAKRQADNKAAYNAVIDELTALQGKLDAAKAEAAKDYAGFDVDALITEAQKAIDDAKSAASEEDAAVAGEGTFAYVLDKETIEAAIAAIVPEAKRQADNKAAYDAAIAEIDALEADYDAAVKEVAEKYPDADVKEYIDAAKAALDAARLAADDAFAAVAQDGEFDYTVNKAEIEALVEDIIEQAKHSGIDAVLIEDLGGDVKFYNLNGVHVKTPAPGSVVIAVGANGLSRKILVK